MTARLPEPQASRAILVGAARFARAGLPDLPSVSHNLADLAAALTSEADGILPPDRCHVVEDPALPHELGLTLSQLAPATEDTLIVYFSGHGLLDSQGELHLATAGTDPDPGRIRYTAFPYDWLRRELADAPARNRIVVLDCCFSGRATQAMSSPAALVAGQLPISGTYTLASAPGTSTAAAPVGMRHTAFTGELLALLRSGVPGAPELLTLKELHDQLLVRLTAKGLPKPQSLNSGTADRLALGRNRAYRPPQPVEPPPVAGDPARMTGTYMCTGPAGAQFLRFLRSGEVLWLASFAPPAEVARWLRPGAAGLLTGTYQLSGDSVRCTVDGPAGIVQYTGSLAEGRRTLRLTTQDHLGQLSAAALWKLVPATEKDGNR
ncbi:caspase family protein [Longispora albida]|uniref:caspase family protein n=1 Tax=Longispora albida TaxID=203523 RepID=UPI0003757AF6|nr:caspase family protein [Longispora albida]